MPSNCGVGKGSWVPWTARRLNQSILKKSTLNIHWKDWCWSWSSNTLATWFEELTHWKRHWCWERLKAGGEGDDRGWDGWMASLTQWTWVWANSERWWRTGKPGVLQSMGSQGVKTWLSDWTTKSGWKKSFSSLTPLIRWTAGLTNNEISWPRPYFDRNTRTMSYLLRDS